jgi:hypothetical protein
MSIGPTPLVVDVAPYALVGYSLVAEVIGKPFLIELIEPKARKRDGAPAG